MGAEIGTDGDGSGCVITMVMAEAMRALGMAAGMADGTAIWMEAMIGLGMLVCLCSSIAVQTSDFLRVEDFIDTEAETHTHPPARSHTHSYMHMHMRGFLRHSLLVVEAVAKRAVVGEGADGMHAGVRAWESSGPRAGRVNGEERERGGVRSARDCRCARVGRGRRLRTCGHAAETVRYGI